MKNYILILVALLAFENLKAQEKTTAVEKNQFKINILSPGVTYEAGIGKNATLCTDANLSIGVSYNSNSGRKWLYSPYIGEQYRYYYNLDKRNSNGKNVKNNSGNFISLSGSYYFKPIGNSEFVSVYDGFTIAPTWGLQRTYTNGININLVTGAGYNLGTNNRVAGFVPVINFTLGWVIK
jgi:hypothetical protein